MLVDAIYDNGRVLFPQLFRFAHNRFSIKVDLPDMEVVEKGAVSQGNAAEIPVGDESRSFAREYPAEYLQFKHLQEASFGKQYEYVQEKSDRELMQEHWLEKHA